MREKGQTEAAKTLETPVFSRGIEILTEKSEFLYPKKLVFKSENLYYEALKDAIAEGEKPPHKRKKRKSQPPAGKEQ